nr:piggyBac transposable element-derived protein 4-like [Penaeus vannamei]
MKTRENMTVEELQSFIGFRLLMGLQPRPHSRYYWSKNRLLSSSVFPETMTRDGFDALQSRLHFSDNEDPRADTDRLWKLRPVLDILDTTFNTVYVPGKKIVVDESLWAFRGRHHAIQFNPTKRGAVG